MPEHDFVPYDVMDDDYAGARRVVAAERTHLRLAEDEKVAGIALSGGGIRSASFCLGVLQALASNDRLKCFQYLSTVSGGGYIGGALTWLWSGRWRDARSTVRFDASPSGFPFGSGVRHDNPDADMDRLQASLMRHLRQHGKYLIPGHGITSLSFLSVVLRGILMGLLAFLVLSGWVFDALHHVDYFGDIGGANARKVVADPYFSVGISGLAAWASVIVYVLGLLMYALPAGLYVKNLGDAYIWRRRWEQHIPIFLMTAVTAVFLYGIEWARILFENSINSLGGFSTVIGAVLSWMFRGKGESRLLGMIPGKLVLMLSLVLFLVGLLVVADQLVVLLISSGIQDLLWWHLLAAALVLLAARLVPINKVSIHRFYRDRLMELFNPDVLHIIDDGESYQSPQANQTGVHKCVVPAGTSDGKAFRPPYHIINTNLILVASEVAKFRGRGGDNFIISPLYSGSNATGWRSTAEFAGGSITLPTAVAISGAAANPDSGVAGKGLTTSHIVSVLMSIFNLRLGYWTTNPDPDHCRKQSVSPSYFKPGFWGTLRRSKINEKSKFIQLSDGGHFENLALYELLRRKCRLIVCCDGEADPHSVFEGLANLMERARVDFGVRISISDTDMVALSYGRKDDGSLRYAERGYLVTDILYADGTEGQLVYIKTTLPADLPGDVYSYCKTHPSFPDETTVDQFFDEQQMEAYRMLGNTIAKQMLKDEAVRW